jgi:hypothetical protein
MNVSKNYQNPELRRTLESSIEDFLELPNITTYRESAIVNRNKLRDNDDVKTYLYYTPQEAATPINPLVEATDIVKGGISSIQFELKRPEGVILGSLPMKQPEVIQFSSLPEDLTPEQAAEAARTTFSTLVSMAITHAA